MVSSNRSSTMASLSHSNVVNSLDQGVSHGINLPNCRRRDRADSTGVLLFQRRRRKLIETAATIQARRSCAASGSSSSVPISHVEIARVAFLKRRRIDRVRPEPVRKVVCEVSVAIFRSAENVRTEIDLPEFRDIGVEVEDSSDGGRKEIGEVDPCVVKWLIECTPNGVGIEVVEVKIEIRERGGDDAAELVAALSSCDEVEDDDECCRTDKTPATEPRRYVASSVIAMWMIEGLWYLFSVMRGHSLPLRNAGASLKFGRSTEFTTPVTVTARRNNMMIGGMVKK
ncbi:hypothetical protein Lal_00025305 [Lupinus albus]|nr:hypothetical protein Lal_00025305 [Lupinus albus]